MAADGPPALECGSSLAAWGLARASRSQLGDRGSVGCAPKNVLAGPRTRPIPWPGPRPRSLSTAPRSATSRMPGPICSGCNGCSIRCGAGARHGTPVFDHCLIGNCLIGNCPVGVCLFRDCLLGQCGSARKPQTTAQANTEISGGSDADASRSRHWAVFQSFPVCPGTV